MTCIVGIETEGIVLIAGDIQGTGGNSKVVHTQPKVFVRNGVGFGYTTSYRFGQLIEHVLPDQVVPEKDAEVYRWLITVLVPKLKASFKEADYDKGGNALIGVRGQLWELQEDFSVLRSRLGYSAVGSGCEYAMGVLHAYMHLKPSRTPRACAAALRLAIEAAGTYSPSVGTESTLVQVA